MNPTDYAINRINKCFKDASDRLWADQSHKPKRVVHHKNYSIEFNNLGIMTKVCDCGWSGSDFRDLTAERCPGCWVVFKE